jgi:nucleoside-diphosphate-sugar epimerase
VKVFLAGATGVLGAAVVPKLVRAGHEVTGLARSPGKAALLTVLGARPVVVSAGVDGEGESLREVAAAVEGHDVLVNVATHIPGGASAVRRSAWKENDRIRTVGSRVLLDAASKAGVSRFVQEAVGFVYADGGSAWLTERAPTEPTRVTESSMTATRQTLGYGDGLHFAVVLRLGQLYGDDALSRWQMGMARKGRACVMGRPDGYVSPLHVEDAADAIVASLGAPSGVYNVAGEPATRTEYAAVLGAAAGHPEPAKFVPDWQQRLLGWRAETMGRSIRMSSEAFARATGWRAKTSLKDGWP